MRMLPKLTNINKTWDCKVSHTTCLENIKLNLKKFSAAIEFQLENQKPKRIFSQFNWTTIEFSLKNLKLKRKHVFHLIQFPGSDLSWKQFSLLLFLCCQENLINRNLYLDFHWKTKQMEVICKKKHFWNYFLPFVVCVKSESGWRRKNVKLNLNKIQDLGSSIGFPPICFDCQTIDTPSRLKVN